jgi:hypothetical protein
MGGVILLGVIADNQFAKYRERRRQANMLSGNPEGAPHTAAIPSAASGLRSAE